MHKLKVKRIPHCLEQVHTVANHMQVDRRLGVDRKLEVVDHKVIRRMVDHRFKLNRKHLELLL